MTDIDVVARALRSAESGDDYRHQQLASISGERFRKVGAYGIVDKRWTELAEAAGYAGADWRDPAIQDSIAKQKLQRDFDTYGSWEAAIIAFRFGAQAAKAHVDHVAHPGSKDVNDYMRSVMTRTKDTESGVIGKVRKEEPEQTQNLGRAQTVIRDQLVTMRDSQRKRTAQTEAEEEPTQEEPIVETGVIEDGS